jgi:thermitase
LYICPSLIRFFRILYCKQDKRICILKGRCKVENNSSLLVGFVPQTTEEQKSQLHTKLGVKLITKFPEINVEVIEVTSNDLKNKIVDYQSSIHVAFIEENKYFIGNNILKSHSSNFLNDRFYRQWGLKRVEYESAWEVAKQMKQKVTIAILDTGIDPYHPILSSRIVKPVNFSTKNRKDYQDMNGHGTHVAGIIAGVTNTKIGSKKIPVSIGKIMPIKVIGPNGGQSKWIIAGVLYAVLNGAKVINISIGGPPFSKALQRAINFAWQKGAVIVAAAGNEGIEQVEYPAGYNFVLAVSAANEDQMRAKFSNWGMNIGVTAPGTSILSTTPTYPTPNRLPIYDSLHGTSQATPLVSGLAALLLAINPDLKNSEVIQMIQRAAIPIDGKNKQWNHYFGYGLLNVKNALNLSMESKTPNFNWWQTSDKGCFYGQIVDQLENPLANAVVTARLNGRFISKYKTRNNVPTEKGTLDTDGMFRLKNLIPGKYSIFVELPGHSLIDMGNFRITAGADTILQLVCKT